MSRGRLASRFVASAASSRCRAYHRARPARGVSLRQTRGLSLRPTRGVSLRVCCGMITGGMAERAARIEIAESSRSHPWRGAPSCALRTTSAATPSRQRAGPPSERGGTQLYSGTALQWLFETRSMISKRLADGRDCGAKVRHAHSRKRCGLASVPVRKDHISCGQWSRRRHQPETHSMRKWAVFHALSKSIRRETGAAHHGGCERGMHCPFCRDFGKGAQGCSSLRRGLESG